MRASPLFAGLHRAIGRRTRRGACRGRICLGTTHSATRISAISTSDADSSPAILRKTAEALFVLFRSSHPGQATLSQTPDLVQPSRRRQVGKHGLDLSASRAESTKSNSNIAGERSRLNRPRNSSYFLPFSDHLFQADKLLQGSIPQTSPCDEGGRHSSPPDTAAITRWIVRDAEH